MPDREPLIRPLIAGDQPRLAALFRQIDSERYLEDFAPHPFTETEAERVCSRPGRDLYVGVSEDEGALVGYGMARGWEEGYDVPSLGLCILESHQGLGFGRALMDYLVAACRERGAGRVRLKVKGDNAGARALYENAGFALEPFDDDFLVGYRAL